MKKVVGLGALLASVCISALAQVDTSYIYNTSMPYGTLDLRIAKSATRYYYLQEDVTFSYRESSPGVKTNTYRDMTPRWESSAYKQGNLREKNGNIDLFVMNYRIMFPTNYDPNVSTGYPIMLSLHGAGETGNCWDENCKWASTSWNPNTNNPPAPTDEYHELLNNDKNLTQGGLKYLKAVSLAAGHLPNDTTINPRGFPGFVLFPQSLNGWSNASTVEDAIRLLRIIVKKYNIDKNRIYIQGISNGGIGVNQAVKRAPWLFACYLTMSAPTDGGITSSGMLREIAKVPAWIFQGGKDTNPTPARTYSLLNALRKSGATVRYSLYSNLGHGTWNMAHDEDDFYQWIRKQKKTNPHVYYDAPVICKTNGSGVLLAFSKGFSAYQWEKDGKLIEASSSDTLIVTAPGVYRGRFSRMTTNPNEGQWEEWSDPIKITEYVPTTSSIATSGTTHLRGPGLESTEENNRVVLTSATIADAYYWYKDGKLIDFQHTTADDTVSSVTLVGTNIADNGIYKLVTQKFNCRSKAKDSTSVFFNNSYPVNISLDPTRLNIRLIPSDTSVLIMWEDLISNETAFEIWRRKKGSSSFSFAGKTGAHEVSFLDQNLEPETVYEYKIRAINNNGASNYAPSNNLAVNYEVKTTTPYYSIPFPPQNLTIKENTTNSISLKFVGDYNGIPLQHYIVHFGNKSLTIPANQNEFTITDLPANMLFPISVRAVDTHGGVSQPSNQVFGSTIVDSLTYRHNTGVWTDIDDPSYINSMLSPEFTGKSKNFNLDIATQDNYFNIQFQGYINISHEGNYYFKLSSDDGSRLLIDDKIVVDNNGNHGGKTEISTATFLSKGFHSIEVQYFQYSEDLYLTVAYKGPGVGDGNTFVEIPDGVLVSAKRPDIPEIKSPENLTVSSRSLQTIALAWTYDQNEKARFEITRATNSSGPFIHVATSTTINVIDSLKLIPGQKYYYRVKAITDGAISDESKVLETSTVVDSIAPTRPGKPSIVSQSQNQVAIEWRQSKDNHSISYYEVFVNGELFDATNLNGFGLNINDSIYFITVRSIDLQGNRSEYSDELYINNSSQQIFFCNSANLNELTSWNTNLDGTGQSPLGFDRDNQIFIIPPRFKGSIDHDLQVSGKHSKMVVHDQAELTINAPCNCNMEVMGSSQITINEGTSPRFNYISSLSRLVFLEPSELANHAYGHLTISSSKGIKLQSNLLKIEGSLTINTLTGLEAPIEQAPVHILIAGDLVITDSVHLPNVSVSFTKSLNHTLLLTNYFSAGQMVVGNGGKLDLKSNRPSTLILGREDGGGLILNEEATINLNNNNLNIHKYGSINTGNTNGSIRCRTGAIHFSTLSPLPSYLYFDANDHTLSQLHIDAPAGEVHVKSKLNILKEVTILNGELYSNGFIRLLASENGSAQINQIEGNGRLIGKIVFDQIIDANLAMIDYGVPLKHVPVKELQKFTPLTGSFHGADELSDTPSFFIYDDNHKAFLAQPTTNNTEILQTGKGYRWHLYDQRSDTLSIAGSVVQGAFQFPLNHGDARDPESGWNFLSNPYPSDVVLTNSAAWTRKGLSNIVATINMEKIGNQWIRQFRYVDITRGSVILKPGQPFWIQSVNVTPRLIVDERAKSTGGVNDDYEDNPYLVIRLSNDILDDEAYLGFTDNSKESYHGILDAVKRENQGMFGISTVKAGFKLAVNSINDNICSKVIPIHIDNLNEGTYDLTISNIKNLDPDAGVILYDRYNNTETVLKNDSPYSFIVTNDSATSNSQRFSLKVTRKTISMVKSFYLTDTCTTQNAVVNIPDPQKDIVYTVIDQNENTVSEPISQNEHMVKLSISPANLNEGQNIFRIKASYEPCSLVQIYDPLIVNFSRPAFVNIVEDTISTCNGDTQRVNVSGAPNGRYFWYKDNALVSNDSVLTVESITTPQKFIVEAINSLGCKTKPDSVLILPINLNAELSLLSDTLKTTTNGALTFDWFREGSLVASSTENYYIPEVGGSYTVIVSDGRCSSAESNPVVFIAESSGLVVYPNPAKSGRFSIKHDFKGKDELKLTIIGIDGRVYYHSTLLSTLALNEIEINRQLPVGMYIITLSQNGEFLKTRITVQP